MIGIQFSIANRHFGPAITSLRCHQATRVCPTITAIIMN